GHDDMVMALAYAPGGQRLVSGGLEGSLRVWEIATGRPKVVLQGHPGGVTCLAYAPTGRQFATAGTDKTVKMWDAMRPPVKPLATLPGAPQDGRNGPRLILRGHTLPVLSVAFAPDGKTLASSSGDPDDFDPERGLLGELKLWDLDTGKEKAAYQGHGDIVFAATFAP